MKSLMHQTLRLQLAAQLPKNLRQTLRAKTRAKAAQHRVIGRGLRQTKTAEPFGGIILRDQTLRIAVARIFQKL